MTIPCRTIQHLASAKSLTLGDDALWCGHKFVWKHASSWHPQLTAWLMPRFRIDAMRRLKPGLLRDLCWDDPEWSNLLERCLVADLDYHSERLADALESAVLRTYHGCRTDDARSYFEHGLRVHDRASMTAKLRAIVEGCEELSWLNSRVEVEIARTETFPDVGRLYVVADDNALLNNAAHYLIYGSEWITGVLGDAGRRVLQRTGVPTLLEIDLPLRVATFQTRKELADRMFAEWTRYVCNQSSWHAPIDFSFALRNDIPPAWVVGHSHPSVLRDPLEKHQLYRAPSITCAYCADARPS